MKKNILLPLLLVASLSSWAQKDSVTVKKDNQEIKVTVKTDGGNEKKIVVYKKYVITDEEDVKDVMEKIRADDKKPSDSKKEIRKQVIIVDGNDENGKVVRQIDINVPNLDSIEQVIETEIAKMEKTMDKKIIITKDGEKRMIIRDNTTGDEKEVTADNNTHTEKNVNVNTQGDTTMVVVGKRKIIITKDGVSVKKQNDGENWENEDVQVEENVDVSCDNKGEKRKRKRTQIDWFGLDLGLNSYLTQNRVGKTPENAPIDLNAWRSVHVATHFLPTRVSLAGRGAVNLKSAITLDFNNLMFKNDFDIDPNATTFTTTPSAVNLKKNKLLLTYAQIPLLLNFNTRPGSKKGVSFSAGGYVGYLLDAKSKHIDINDHKTKNHDDYQINPLKYGLTARLDFKWFDFYVNYNLSNLFADNTVVQANGNPKTQIVSAGLNLINF